MHVLQKDKWVKVTAKKNVAGRFPTLKECNKGSGDVTFVVKGEPHDADLDARVQAHETHHARDDERLFNRVLGPWDTAVTKAQTAKTTAKGGDVKICERVLYVTAVGPNQTPDEVSLRLAHDINQAGIDFHTNDPAGKKEPIKPESSDSSCNVVTARVG